MFQFFCFFFVFSVFVALFFFYLFFFLSSKDVFHLKKKEQNIYKKRNSWVFFVGCKFPPDKRGRTTGQTRGQGQTDQLAYKHKL